MLDHVHTIGYACEKLSCGLYQTFHRGRGRKAIRRMRSNVLILDLNEFKLSQDLCQQQTMPATKPFHPSKGTAISYSRLISK